MRAVFSNSSSSSSDRSGARESSATTDRPMNLLPGETTLLSYDASHRKGPGRIYLTNQRVAWCAAGSAIPSVSLPLPEIRGNLTSKAGGGPPMIKLTNTGDPTDAKVPGYRFEFHDTRVGKADRDAFHEKLAAMLKKITPRPSPAASAAAAAAATGGGGGEATTSTGVPRAAAPAQASMTHTTSAVVTEAAGAQGDRETLLDADTDLRLVHDQLVGAGIITEEEFWEGRRVRSARGS